MLLFMCMNIFIKERIIKMGDFSHSSVFRPKSGVTQTYNSFMFSVGLPKLTARHYFENQARKLEML